VNKDRKSELKELGLALWKLAVVVSEIGILVATLATIHVVWFVILPIVQG